MPLGTGWVGTLGTPEGLEAIFKLKDKGAFGNWGGGEWVSELKK